MLPVYHGTDVGRAERIRKGGPRFPHWVTDSAQEAHYYAMENPKGVVNYRLDPGNHLRLEKGDVNSLQELEAMIRQAQGAGYDSLSVPKDADMRDPSNPLEDRRHYIVFNPDTLVPAQEKTARQPAYVNQWVEQTHPGEQHGHQSDCINPKCDYHFPPQVIHELEQYGEVKCPNCGLLQNIMGTVGPYEGADHYTDSMYSRGNRPGGGTRAGLTLNEMGRIGQEVAKRAQIPGFTYQSEFTQPQWPIDQIWHDQNGQPHGMEIKSCHSMAQPRFKLGDARERQKKVQYCAENGLRQGLIGVRLNFYTNQADVFHRPQFTDTWVGAPNMMHVGTYDFSDLNPFKHPGEVPDNLPEEQDDIPF